MDRFSRFKDPDEVIRVSIDWSDKLALSSPTDSISTSTWILESGITLDSETETTTDATATISGGTRGNAYNCTNRITTSAGETWDRTVRVYVAML